MRITNKHRIQTGGFSRMLCRWMGAMLFGIHIAGYRIHKNPIGFRIGCIKTDFVNIFIL